MARRPRHNLHFTTIDVVCPNCGKPQRQVVAIHVTLPRKGVERTQPDQTACPNCHESESGAN